MGLFIVLFIIILLLTIFVATFHAGAEGADGRWRGAYGCSACGTIAWHNSCLNPCPSCGFKNGKNAKEVTYKKFLRIKWYDPRSWFKIHREFIEE